MDKPLSDKEKKYNAPAAVDLSQATIGAYAPELTAQQWERERQPWNASPQGRLAIRVFSRGVLGAAFFTTGGLVASKWLQDYDREAGLLSQKNPLSFISKLIDIAAGKPIEVTVREASKLLGREAEAADIGRRAVTFRPTHRFTSAAGQPLGRSLGHEMSLVTFDFFCASIGDALGRDIAGWVDPNASKKWMKNGRVDWPEAVKGIMKSTWRYVSYNGGEDWAVALPYCYFMKAQRGVINHFSPGFAMDFDRNLNGASQKWDSKTNQVTGNYNRAGLLDLQNRFVVYNMGTLMYREVYNFIGDTIKGKKNSLWGSPDKEPARSIGEKAGNLVKWVARSVVKAGIYMTPAVPFFWVTRTPQTKFRAAYIDGRENAILLNADSAPHLIDHAQVATTARPDAALSVATYNGKVYSHRLHEAGAPRNAQGELFKVYEHERGVLNAVGRANNYAMNEVGKLAGKADGHFGKFGENVKSGLGIKSFKNFTNTYVNSAVSYMPYMYAKAEFGNLWDDGKMDMSIERAIDGAIHFNPGEFAQGVRDIGYSILHKPLLDPAREEEAQRRIYLDTSAAVDFLETKGEMTKKDSLRRHLEDTRQHERHLKWSERLFHGGSKRDPKISGHKQAASFAEQEAMRKALEELQPPTNSVN